MQTSRPLSYVQRSQEGASLIAENFSLSGAKKKSVHSKPFPLEGQNTMQRDEQAKPADASASLRGLAKLGADLDAGITAWMEEHSGQRDPNTMQHDEEAKPPAASTAKPTLADLERELSEEYQMWAQESDDPLKCSDRAPVSSASRGLQQASKDMLRRHQAHQPTPDQERDVEEMYRSSCPATEEISRLARSFFDPFPEEIARKREKDEFEMDMLRLDWLKSKTPDEVYELVKESLKKRIQAKTSGQILSRDDFVAVMRETAQGDPEMRAP